MSGQEDAEEDRREYRPAYTPHHPIPTISQYHKEKAARQEEAAGVDDEQTDVIDKDIQSFAKQHKERETARRGQSEDEDAPRGRGQEQRQKDSTEEYEAEEVAADTSEVDPFGGQTKQRQKHFKKRKDERAERQVTDPVTHLPVTIHDFTSAALKDIPHNDPPFGTTSRTATGSSNKSKSKSMLRKENREMERGDESMRALFPPPEYDLIRQQLEDVNKKSISIGLAGVAIILAAAIILEALLRAGKRPNTTPKHEGLWTLTNILTRLMLVLMALGAIWALIMGLRDWVAKQIDDVWEEEVWEASRRNAGREIRPYQTETVTWLNSLLEAVWPLVNPDLFASLCDTLEDVMQASLPKHIVHMVAINDLGQGSESLRILGIRCLPTGAASRSVGADGKLKAANISEDENDRRVPGEGEIESASDNEQRDRKIGQGEDTRPDKGKQQHGDGTPRDIAEGMEAEEGDFINIEVAFAYRARSKKSFKERSQDMHLLVVFYLPGNLKVPVWVDVRGVIGTMRMRLQLTPDPPFFALCTFTLLGQPKVKISCTPLIKQGPNIMDIPLISNFVQSSVDAAMAEYVAPKSLTIDLKDMLAGDDFKKDTHARGVLVVHVKRGYDFKMGDPGIPLIKQGSSDPYVSVGWAKFGKPLWNTRILLNDMEPCWRETAYLLVTPEELNVDERLRLQLWDSDKFDADDDLGRIELDLKGLMKSHETNGIMQARVDGFKALKAGETMPGKLEWSVGYFSKARLQPCQLQRQTYWPEIRSMEQLEQKVDKDCRRKMREADIKRGRKSKDTNELELQKAQEMKATQDAMIVSAPPPERYPSGIFGIQIHQIIGLELEKLSKGESTEESDDEKEAGEGLPSAYCTVIINHSKIFKTRTKPKNAKPFFNAGVERFIPDWQNAEVYVTVRDARVKEDDPLLGIVHLSLGDIFKERSQINGFYPLMGGVGFGRIRLSMVWRSIQLQAPPNELGWNYGTLEIQPGIQASGVPKDLQQLKIRFYTDLGYGKMYPGKEKQIWDTSKGKSLKLPVKKRYSSCLAIQFRHHGHLKDRTAAFAVLWLREIPDEAKKEITLPIWKGNYKRAIACSLDECGEKVGSMTVNLTFWSGLGSAHSKWASRNPHVRDVVEVLDAARDNLEAYQNTKEAGIVDEDYSSSDEDSSGDEEKADHKAQADATNDVDLKGGNVAKSDNDDGDQGSSERTILDSVKDYKKHMKSEHRRHRGLMQWKIPRTAEHAWHKVEQVGSRSTEVFKRHSREPGLETEV
ncbi:hypothetical protein M433DRAFT_541955 [Acidomyces richmondensis BFW]|nr:hypothetical protein M433DRAFT_541955 [Acidomyces richmondensis BFW]